MKNEKEVQELIKSKQLVINNKFLVKISVFDSGVSKKTYLIVVKSLLDDGFKMKFFDTEQNFAAYLQMLNLT